jgi:chemotaxis protein CheD
MNIINVGMGELQVTKHTGTALVAPGLGSCIGLIMYDSKAKVAGMVHVVLPDSANAGVNGSLPGKYADSAIPELLNNMVKVGASKSNIVVKIAGGAQMFNLEKGGNILNIGIRNTIAVKAALNKENLSIKASDTGGNKGRTFKIEIATGKVYVRSIGQQEVEL